MRGTLCPLVLPTLALTLAGGCGARLDPKWQGLLPLADEPLVEQDPEIQKLADQFAKTPHSDVVRLAFSQGLLRRGRLPEAVTVLASAVRDDPRDERAATTLLKTTQILGMPQEFAGRICQGIINDDQDNQGALWVLGELLLARNQMQAAQDCLERAWRQEPRFWLPAVSLARLAGLQLRQDEARRWCARAEQAAPGGHEAKVQLAEAYLQAGMPGKAVALCRDAVRLEPRYPRSSTLLGWALIAASRPDEAIEALGQAIAGGEDAQTRARALHGSPAMMAYLGDKQRERYWLLGQAYSELATGRGRPRDEDRAYGLLERARDALEKAVPDTAGTAAPAKARLRLAIVYGRLAEIDDGRAATSPTAEGVAWREEMVRSERAKAIEQYERALKDNVDAVLEDGVVVYNDLAYLYAEEGHHLDAALELAQTALDLAPALATYDRSGRVQYQMASCYDTLGWVQYQMADYPSAVGSLLKAKELAPAAPEILRHLALAYRRSGKADQSGPLLQQALKLTEGEPSLAGLRKRLEAELQDTKAG